MQFYSPMMKKIWRIILCAVYVAVFLWPVQEHRSLAADAEESSGSEIVSCADGFVKVDARDIRPEDLMKEVGEKCGIKIVILGDAFGESPISIKFNKMPIRRALERILRTSNVTNFVVRFDQEDESTRVAELYIVGKKGGEKQLTAGGPRPTKPLPVMPEQPVPQAPAQERREMKKEAKEELTKEETAKLQENFLKIMDEILKNQEGGEEPDPGEILRLFKDAVPPDMKDQIPPEVLEELEKLEAMSPQKK